MLKRVLIVAVGLLASVTLGGCLSAPRQVLLSDLRDETLARELAPQYWSREDMPALTEPDGGRLVISEFAVEFITAKKEGPFESQPRFSFPPISPIGVGIELSGLGRKRILFGDETQSEVVAVLKDQLEDLLNERFGYEIVPLEEVVSAEAYKRFKLADEIEERRNVFQQANLIGTDTGRVRAAELRTLPPLGIIEGTNDGSKVREVERAIAEEVGAEASLRVKMRVGSYRGLAALEKNSRILLTTLPTDSGVPGFDGTFESMRSFLSEERVSEIDGAALVQGARIEVDREKFIDEISVMIEVSLDLFNRVLRGDVIEED